MKILSHLFLIQAVFVVSSAETRDAVVYYVKPSEATTNCTGQPCYTLQNCLESITMDTAIKNATMIIMPGIYTVLTLFTLKISVINMTGESQGVILKGQGGFKFIGGMNSELYLSKFATQQIGIDVYNFSSFSMSSVKLDQSLFAVREVASVRFDLCEFNDYSMFIDTKYLTMENCKLVGHGLNIERSTVVFSGNSQFTDANLLSAITTFSSNITLSGEVIFANNSGIRGGAIALYYSTLNVAPGTKASFVNNTAIETGGAIYIYPNQIPDQLTDMTIDGNFHAHQNAKLRCFYQLLNCSDSDSYIFSFANNSAVNGGDDIYGTTLEICQTSGNCKLTIHKHNSGLSSVSSYPTRVCLCDSEGNPNCLDNNRKLAVHPGEIFTISAVVVGGDLGTTTGSIYTDFSLYDHPSLPSLSSASQYVQIVSSVSHCSSLNYSLYNYTMNDNDNHIIKMYLTTVKIDPYNLNPHSSADIHTSPVILRITQLPCPPGFTLIGEPPACGGYRTLTDKKVECNIVNGKGLFSWSGGQWIAIDGNGIAYSHYCPFNYCNPNKAQQIDLENDSDVQCSFNRAGRLCGGCKENYSLAIGSSHCIHCPNSNNIALLIFFVAAGFLLVLFISIFNLTVTQGMINGLIFYANIVWTYQSIFFVEDQELSSLLVFLKTFIAWINLDLGIESCFVNGLTAFWKTLLQFVFPFYIWVIAGLIIITAKYSSKLTNLLANRGVPVLNTLFLLSYMKLLRVVVTTLDFSFVIKYPQGFTSVVWSKDGNLVYFGFPHILLFIAGLGTLCFLWLPYTLLLFSMQWLRKIPSFVLLKWIMRFNPVYDAYFAPLKHKHQYWFGVLLLARGVLLVTFASTFTVPQSINLLLLLTIGILLLFCMALTQPYKSKTVFFLQSFSLVNLTILGVFAIFAYSYPNGPSIQTIVVGLSTGVAFIQFCGIVLYALIAPRCSCKQRHRPLEGEGVGKNFVDPVENVSDSSGYRDSILDDDQDEKIADGTRPLVTNDSGAILSY